MVNTFEDDNYLKRFNESRSFLCSGGYLTDGENRKIKDRFRKAAAKSGTKLETLPFFIKQRVNVNDFGISRIMNETNKERIFC